MSVPTPHLTLPTDIIHIAPWSDPVLDQLGHDARSTYVEKFWLPILGPTTTLFLRHVAHQLDSQPEGFDLDVVNTATALGLGTMGGRNAPFVRAMARAAKFKLARLIGHDTLAVHGKIPPLTRVQLERLPAPIRDEHTSWQERARQTPDVEQQKRRARRLALSLVELGESDEQVEQQLHRWRIHPAMAHEALRWAHERRKDAQAAAKPPQPQPALIRSSGAPSVLGA